jgi:hypothetical protein
MLHLTYFFCLTDFVSKRQCVSSIVLQVSILKLMVTFGCGLDCMMRMLSLTYFFHLIPLRENFVDRPESYDSFSSKSCVFLAHGLGCISPFPYTTWPKARYQKILRTFTYYTRTITNIIMFYFPLPCNQISRSRIWEMISEKFKCRTFKAALDRYL